MILLWFVTLGLRNPHRVCSHSICQKNYNKHSKAEKIYKKKKNNNHIFENYFSHLEIKFLTRQENCQTLDRVS